MYPDATHGGLGPLCKWETDTDCEYRVLPVSTIERVCAVVPHVGDDALCPAAWPPDYTRVVHWWVNVHNRDRAGPARGVDWLAGVPEEARRRPAPVQEAMCESCGGLGSTDKNKMYLCDAAGCLRGWHKLCLRAASCGVPRRGESFHCSLHSAAGGDDVTAMRVD